MSEKNWTTTNQMELDPKDIIDESFIYRNINVNSGADREIRASDYVFHLYPASYGRKYFLVYKGKLRQFKMVRTYLCPWNYNFTHNGKRVVAIHELEICGLGTIFVAHNNGSGTNFVCKVYHSVEHYKNGQDAYLGYKADNLAEINIFPFDFVKEPSYFSNCELVAKMWRWNGTRAVAENVTNVPMFYSFDGDNYEIPNEEDYELPCGYYCTKDMCEKDNAIEVEYFAEEEESNEVKTTTETIFGIEYQLTEDEKNKLKELVATFKLS